MAEKIPSVQESLAEPTKPGVAHRLSKNLHFILGGAIVAALSVALLYSAAQDDKKREAVAETKAAAGGSTAAGNTRAPSKATLDEEIEAQTAKPDTKGKPGGDLKPSVAGDVTPSSLKAQPANPAAAAVGGGQAGPAPLPTGTPSAAQSSPATGGMGDVPRQGASGSGTAAATGAGQDSAQAKAAREDAIEAARRQEQIRASGLIALQDRVQPKAADGAVGGQRRPTSIAEIDAQRNSAMLGVEQTKNEIARLAGAGSAGGGGALALNRPVSVATGIDNNQQFLRQNREENANASTLATIRPDGKVQPGVITQGNVIPVALYQSINSDAPGEVTAVVTMNVYESYPTGATPRLLLPMGSRIVGAYNNDVRPGQERVVSAYNRLILPNGTSVNLGGMQGYDLEGTAGLEADVNNHFWKMFGSSFLIAGIAAVIDAQTKPTVVSVNTPQASLSGAAGQTLNDVTRTILEKNRNIPPTLTIKKGHKFNILVRKDLALPEYRL